MNNGNALGCFEAFTMENNGGIVFARRYDDKSEKMQKCLKRNPDLLLSTLTEAENFNTVVFSKRSIKEYWNFWTLDTSLPEDTHLIPLGYVNLKY